MRQVSLVSFYGKKEKTFQQFVLKLQDEIKKVLQDKYFPYPTPQIHGTIISLERIGSSRFYNRNFSKYRNLKLQMNFKGFLSFTRKTNLYPLEIQIGGFQPEFKKTLSQGHTLFERSFSISNNLPVIIGWPIKSSEITDNLFELRKAYEKFGILHKHHKKSNDRDNDYYIRLGFIDNDVEENKLNTIQNLIREYIFNKEIQRFVINLSDLYLVSYEDEKLPFESTCYISITNSLLSEKFIERLYE